jgi:hypothetical protein
MAQPAELTEHAPDIGYAWRPPDFKFSGTPAAKYGLLLPNAEDNSDNFMRSARWLCAFNRYMNSSTDLF